jgi:hypothetical protein
MPLGAVDDSWPLGVVFRDRKAVVRHRTYVRIQVKSALFIALCGLARPGASVSARVRLRGGLAAGMLGTERGKMRTLLVGVGPAAVVVLTRVCPGVEQRSNGGQRVC